MDLIVSINRLKTRIDTSIYLSEDIQEAMSGV